MVLQGFFGKENGIYMIFSWKIDEECVVDAFLEKVPYSTKMGSSIETRLIL